MRAVRPLRGLVRRAVAYGLLWALVVTLSDLLLASVQLELDWRHPGIYGSVLMEWSACGILLAWVMLALEPRLERRWELALVILAMVFAGTATSTGVLFLQGAAGMQMAISLVEGRVGPSWDHAFFAFWKVLTFGSAFMVACVLVSRSERSRELLTGARIARSRAEAQLDEARVDALCRQVDPRFLLETLSAVQERYAHDAAAADALLDKLVAFLRDAMPGVRSGHSTLRAEVALVRSYAAIRAAIGHGPAVQVEADEPVPDIPFPALLLLPTVNGVAGHSYARLELLDEHDRLAVVVTGPARQPRAGLSPTLLYHLQVAMRALYGESFSLHTRTPTASRGSQLVLALRGTHPASDHQPTQGGSKMNNCRTPHDRSQTDELRRRLLTLLPVLAMASEAQAQDPARTMPGAYRVVFENDKLRVLEFRSKPGTGVCGSGMHSHPAHLTVALTPAKVRVKLPDGKSFVAENQAGDVFWSEAETHETENVGGKDARALLVELKTPSNGSK